MSSHGSFIWYELMTPAPVAAAAFYGDVVGWRIASQPDPAAGEVDYRMIGRADGGHAGGVLALTPAMQAGGARPCWLGYLAVDEVDTTLAAITADGATVLMPPMDLPVGRIALVSDPQGAPFYVMTPRPPPGTAGAASDVFALTAPQHVRWNELATSDPPAAVAFYSRHFGWTQVGEMDMGAMGKYRFVQHHGGAIGAVMPRLSSTANSAWQYYIGVEDIDRAVASIAPSGGRLVQGPIRDPRRGIRGQRDGSGGRGFRSRRAAADLMRLVQLFARVTRQTVLPTSSATSSAPAWSTTTPTGRPQASPR
ncbi:MAG: VOC family protein [Polyangiaceae bacterium]